MTEPFMNTSPSTSKPVFLVSACLVGLCTRYDGATKPNAECKKFLQNSIWIPVCPEQLGGLPTPRSAAEINNGTGKDVLRGTASVRTREDNIDVTDSFITGAQQVLHIARQQTITGVCLKAKSPSCAVYGIVGVTAALLAKHEYTLYEF